MRIVVLVLAEPDLEGRLELDPERRSLEPSRTNWELGDVDRTSLELAVLAKESEGATVDVLTAVWPGGPEGAKILRSAVALGADHAHRVTLGESTGGEPSVEQIADALAEAVSQLAESTPVDLVLCGAQSGAAGTGLTGGYLAGTLDWQWAWLVTGVRPLADGRTVEVERELEAGAIERSQVDLPAVLAIQVGAAEPRMATVRATLMARKAAINELLASASSEAPRGLARQRLAVPIRHSNTERFEGENAVADLDRALRRDGVLP